MLGVYKPNRFYKSTIKWNNFQKTGHFKRYFSDGKDNGDFVQVLITLNKDGYESVGALVVSSLEIEDV